MNQWIIHAPKCHASEAISTSRKKTIAPNTVERKLAIEKLLSDIQAIFVMFGNFFRQLLTLNNPIGDVKDLLTTVCMIIVVIGGTITGTKRRRR